MAHARGRYRVGRAAAGIFTAAGGLGLVVSLPLAGYALVSLSPGAVTTVWLVAAALCGVLLGQIGRAVFDIAERCGAQDGG